MTIVDIRPGMQRVPPRTPFKTALRTVDAIEDGVARLHAGSGNIGCGGAPATAVITGDTHGSIIDAIRHHIAPRLIGQDIADLNRLARPVQGAGRARVVSLREVAMTMRPFSLAVLAFALAGAVHAGAVDVPWHGARQMIVVTTAGWNADHGILRTFERRRGRWRMVGSATPVTVGRNGAGWGLGLNAPQGGGPVKREGDNRSPAGVFRIGQAFGYAARADTAMPYRALTVTDWCVDVSASPHYNRIVDAKRVGDAAVKGASEPMRRDLHFAGDQRYRQGFVIEHNPRATPQAGSCIFAHRWVSPTTATTGCTAMAPAAMRSLLAWLKPRDHPVFVLLPQAEYRRLQLPWRLPARAAP